MNQSEETKVQIMPALSMEALIGWAAAIGVTLLNYKIKLDIKNELEELRKEFVGTFVQVPLASEQRQALLFRLENVEREVGGVRERSHANSQTLTTMGFQLGEVKALADQVPSLAERMADKARRMATAEATIKVNSERLTELANRIHDLERKQ